MKAVLSKRDEKYLDKSLNGTMWKVVLTIGTPLALYHGLQQVFSVLDTMMAAHISSESVSAVAYLSQLNHILAAVGGGLAIGAGIQISHAFGQGDYDLVHKRVSSLYAISFTVGVGMLAIILPFTGQFLQMAGTPETLIAVGSQYFVVQLFTMVVTFLNNVYIAVERARGHAGRIFWLNMGVIAVKLSLTAVFVYILNGDLVMIGLASLISQIFLFAFALKNSFFEKSAFGFSMKAITMKKEVTGPMLSRSWPVITEKALFAFGKTIVNSMSTVYGDTMVGAMGVSNNLGGITTNPQNGFQEGAASIISQNLGAGKYKRVLEAFRAVLIINIILGAVIASLEMWQLDALAGLFDSNDISFHNMIKNVYSYEVWGAIPLGVNASVLALLYGLGKTKLTLVINFSRVFLFRIPVFRFLQNFTNFGEKSAGIVMMVSNVSVGMLASVIALIVVHQFKKTYNV